MLLRFDTLHGQQVKATDGEIGAVRAFYFNDETWSICYLILEIGRWLGSRSVLIPTNLLGAYDSRTALLEARLSRLQIKRAAAIEFKKPVSEQRREARNRRNRLYLISKAPGFSAGERAAEGSISHPATAVGDQHLRSSEELRRNYWVLAQDGDVGPVQDFVIDHHRWEVRYIVVDAGWWFASKLVFLPPKFVDGISAAGNAISTHLRSAAVTAAPVYHATVPLPQYEHQLADYWEQQQNGNHHHESN